MLTKKLFLAIALLLSFGYCCTVQNMQVPSSLVAAIGLACDTEPLIKFGIGFCIGLTSPISLPFSWFFIHQNEREHFDDKGKLSRF